MKYEVDYDGLKEQVDSIRTGESPEYIYYRDRRYRICPVRDGDTTVPVPFARGISHPHGFTVLLNSRFSRNILGLMALHEVIEIDAHIFQDAPTKYAAHRVAVKFEKRYAEEQDFPQEQKRLRREIYKYHARKREQSEAA